MAEFIHDDELDALVRELNSNPAPGQPDAPPTRRVQVEHGGRLEQLLAHVLERGANDLLLVPGSPAALRVGGRLARVDDEALDEDDVRAMLAPHLGPGLSQALGTQGSVDFSLSLAATGSSGTGRSFRFRVNLHRQRGLLAAAVRVLPSEVPTLASLNLPPGLAELVKAPHGLLLVCGPTGAGKTTTLAALVGEITRSRPAHIVTIEDPIEFEHPNNTSVVEQIEVGPDAPSFALALKAALRQNPDVILVGEMRDLETIAIALTAAETGHLILSTLHTSDAVQSIHRVVDAFPTAQQGQIRQQLALSLHAIVCQQLIPRRDGVGRVPALEILIANGAVRNHIRKERAENLYSEITLGKRSGMVTLEESLARLVRAGAITLEDAQLRAGHPEELEGFLRGKS